MNAVQMLSWDRFQIITIMDAEKMCSRDRLQFVTIMGSVKMTSRDHFFFNFRESEIVARKGALNIEGVIAFNNSEPHSVEASLRNILDDRVETVRMIKNFSKIFKIIS